MAYAEDIYKRTKNLWDQGIGTEVQLKTAEKFSRSIERQIGYVELKVGKQLMYMLRSEWYVEQVNLKVGETFSGYRRNGPQSHDRKFSSSMKVVTDVPENYPDRVKKGSHC